MRASSTWEYEDSLRKSPLSACDKSKFNWDFFFMAKRGWMFMINHHLITIFFSLNIFLCSLHRAITSLDIVQQQPIDSCWSSSQTIKITAKSCPCNQINCNAPVDAKRRYVNSSIFCFDFVSCSASSSHSGMLSRRMCVKEEAREYRITA